MGRYQPKNVKGNYKGSNKDEFITGSSKAQTIDGNGGNDALAGRGGNDKMLGGSGNDHLAGDEGKNTLTGGSGTDKFFFRYRSGNAGHAVVTDFSKGEKIVLDSGLFKNYKMSKKGKDTVLTEKGKEFAVVKGVSLNKGDVVNQNGIVFPDPNASKRSADSDADTRGISNAAKNFDQLLEGTRNPDKLTTSKSKSALIIGFDANDTLTGGDKNDKLEGKDGSDRLFGGKGNDILQGKDGNDRLEGGDGNDKLDGGDDNDTLIGGSGNDRFEDDDGKNVFTGGKGKDIFEIEDDDDGFVTITDFSHKHDKLFMDDDYEDGSDRRFYVKGGNMRIELDGDLVAELTGVKKLSNANIIFDD